MQFQQRADGVTVMSGFEKDGVPYRFFLLPVYNHQKSLEAGFEVFDEIEAVEFKKDRRTVHVEQVRFLSPERLKRNIRGEVVGGRFFEAYKRWKAGEEAPGMPLAKWDVIAPAQVKSLEAEHIYSVEQLAAFPGDRLSEIFRGAEEFLHLHERAKLFVGNKDMIRRSKEQFEQLQHVSMENQKLQNQLAELKAVVQGMQKMRNPEEEENPFDGIVLEKKKKGRSE